MSEVPGRGTGALNIERIYSTTVPVEELARTLADHFHAQEFETQVYRTSENRTVMQARKESLWRQLLGVTYALTVVFTPGEGLAEHRPGGTSGLMRRWAGRSVGRGTAGPAGDRVRHLEGEPAGPRSLAGDRRGGQRSRP